MRSARNRRSRMRVRRLSDLSVNRMVPNVLTLLALCAGMTAVRFAMGGNFEAAVFSIIAAGIFDGLDGRMARLLKATSSFGAELDSLSDFVSFGVAPAAVLYLWTLSGLHGLGFSTPRLGTSGLATLFLLFGELFGFWLWGAAVAGLVTFKELLVQSLRRWWGFGQYRQSPEQSHPSWPDLWRAN